MKVYVEGGGDSKMLRTACRGGFVKFLEKAGLKGTMPSVVACGSRRNTYDSFCTAIKSGEEALLLVDSEAPVAAVCQQGAAAQWKPWSHLKNRQGDQWDKPESAGEEHCHLMVQCTEAWFLADRENFGKFFGQGFNMNSLPAKENDIESVDKHRIYRALADATRNCKTKAVYSKGEHSFQILALISPERVTAKSPWAKRFIDTVKLKMGR